MTTLRVAKAEIPSELRETMIRQFGAVAEPVEVTWHNPKVAQAALEFGAKIAAWDAADDSLKTFAHMAVAAQVGCSWCLDINYFQALNQNLDLAKASQVPRWRESELFTPLERDVLEYAEAMTNTPPTVPTSCRRDSWSNSRLEPARTRQVSPGSGEPSSARRKRRWRRAAESHPADWRACRQAKRAACGFGNQVGRVLARHGRDEARLGQCKREAMPRIGEANRATGSRMSKRGRRRTHGRPVAAEHVAEPLVHRYAGDGVGLTRLQRCSLAQALLRQQALTLPFAIRREHGVQARQ